MNRDHVLPAGLSLAAGFVEAVCFIGLFHTFTTYITGTVMIMMIDFIQSKPGALTKAVTFFAFFLFTVMWVTAFRLWRGSSNNRVGVFLVAEAVCIVAFAIVGHVLSPLTSADALGTYVVCVFGVLAMSLHSAIFFQLLKATAPSHFMTGNLTNFSRAFVDLVVVERLRAELPEDEHDDARFRIGYFPLVFGAFIVGVAGGTFALMQMGLICLVIPAIVVLALGIRQLKTA